MFVDIAEITVKSGNGGNGLVSFHREKYVAAGGPDGGDGGNGGSVILVADRQLSTLMDFRYRRQFKAENGGDGKPKKSKGKNGADLYVTVPAGTLVKDESGRIIADLHEDGDTFTAARGGRGGWGNVHFATPTRQVPKFAKPGGRGLERVLTLELKLLADVGLVGFPNVGKSTLLSVVSEARPKIANYHFTTLTPNLGVVTPGGDMPAFVMADIPGIIGGAHTGAGLGHAFLRHVERTRLLLHVIDVSGMEGRDPWEDFQTIQAEMVQFNPALADRPQVIVANKTDLVTDEGAYAAFREKMEGLGYPFFAISAATRQGVDALLRYTAARLSELPIPEIPVEEDLAEAAAEEAAQFAVTVEDGVYVVSGPLAEKIVGSTNFDDYESLQYFQRALRTSGIIAALEEAGIEEGDPVRMDELEFDFVK